MKRESRMGKIGQTIGPTQLRSFGLLMGGVLGIIGIWPLVWRGDEVLVWALVSSGLVALPAVVWPAMLRPVYTLWMRVGAVLGWVNTRIILSLGFYFVFTPIAMMMRVLGKDPLHRGLEPQAKSYRVLRTIRSGSHMRKPF